jgi:transposase InsO family protein
MQELDIETILQRAREKHPDARPRIITDNGPQFISRDFKEFIRVAGMTHVKTSPYYPQSNGKIERYHRTIKGDCIRITALWTLEDARKAVTDYVKHYNEVRLHSAIGYVTPHTKMAGQERAVFSARDAKLEAAREKRRLRRAAAQQHVA